jgi:parvulin-like peptidyl-prolyl isomerase
MKKKYAGMSKICSQGRRRILAAVSVALLLLSGCGAAADDSETVAEVGDIAISENRLTAFTELLFALNNFDLSAVEESEMNLYKAEALDTMAQAAALAQHFEKQGVPLEGVDAALAQFKDDIAQVEGLADSLKKKGITDDTLRYFIETQFYFQNARMEATENDSLPTDEEVEVYYALHEREYPDEEERRVSHILVGDKNHADADRQLAEEIRGKIARGEESFEDMALEHGTDGTRSTGGDLGYAVYADYVPAFSEVAFALPQGELSGVVESEFGFHLLKVTDIRSARSIEAQREAIRTALASELYESALESIAAEFEAVYLSDKYPAQDARTAAGEAAAGAESPAEEEGGADEAEKSPAADAGETADAPTGGTEAASE